MDPIKLFTTKQIYDIHKAEAAASAKLTRSSANSAPRLCGDVRALLIKFPHRVGALVKAVNGNARKYTHCGNDIRRAVLDAEARLSAAGLANAYRTGTTVTQTSEVSTDLVLGHSWNPVFGSKFVIERDSFAWYLISYVREARFKGPGAPNETVTRITPCAAATLSELVLQTFRVHKEVKKLESTL